MNNSHPETDNSFDDTYTDNQETFGKPYKELQDYFNNRTSRGTVLDLGSGQGRDALFLASIGYNVTAIDNSEVGVAQMLQYAIERGLEIKGIASDITNLQMEEQFDVILFDMVLHGFKETQQIDLLKKYSKNVNEDGLLCIVFPDDMNTDYFMNMLNSLPHKWILRDEVIIRDIPKLTNEEVEFTFIMMCVQCS